LPRGSDATAQRLAWATLQIPLIFLAFQVYKSVRKLGIRDDSTEAFDHAGDVINLEEKLGLFFELEWQGWALDQGESYIKFFNYMYAYYMWWVIGGLTLLAFFAPRRYAFMRRAFFISMVLVAPMYLLYPLAPPRFMELHGWPFVDTLAVYGPNYFSETGLVQANRYAAMPSMHVGWTTFVSVAVSLLFSSTRVRMVFIAFFGMLISYIVIVTGNHYWVDGVVGWMFIGTAIVVNRFIPFPLLRRIAHAGSQEDVAPTSAAVSEQGN
jgi:hypothetical protein